MSKPLIFIASLLMTGQAFAMECPKKIRIEASGFTVKRSENNPDQADIDAVVTRNYNSSVQCQYENKDGLLLIIATNYGSTTTYSATLSFGNGSDLAIETMLKEPTASEIEAIGKAEFGKLEHWGFSDGASSSDGDDFKSIGTVKSLQLTVVK